MNKDIFCRNHGYGMNDNDKKSCDMRLYAAH